LKLARANYWYDLVELELCVHKNADILVGSCSQLSYSGEVSRAAHAERVLHKHLSAQAAKASEQLHQFSQLQVHQTQITLDKMRADLSTARQQVICSLFSFVPLI
jgi:hypothetical protein